MKILITGGGGLVGQKLARRLAELGTLRGETITEVVLADILDGPQDCVLYSLPVQALLASIPLDLPLHLGDCGVYLAGIP